MKTTELEQAILKRRKSFCFADDLNLVKDELIGEIVGVCTWVISATGSIGSAFIK